MGGAEAERRCPRAGFADGGGPQIGTVGGFWKVGKARKHRCSLGGPPEGTKLCQEPDLCLGGLCWACELQTMREQAHEVTQSVVVITAAVRDPYSF